MILNTCDAGLRFNLALGTVIDVFTPPALLLMKYDTQYSDAGMRFNLALGTVIDAFTPPALLLMKYDTQYM